MIPSAEDARRSLQRQLSGLLPDYELSPARQAVPDSRRPAGAISSSPASIEELRQGSPDLRPFLARMSVTVTLWPPFTDTGDVLTARHQAEQLASRLLELWLVGSAPVARFPGGRPAEGPLHLALYDYGDAPYAQAPEDPQPVESARIADPSATVIQDPDDPRRFTITGQLQLSWTAIARKAPAPTAPIITSLPGTYLRAPRVGRGVLDP